MHYSAVKIIPVLFLLSVSAFAQTSPADSLTVRKNKAADVLYTSAMNHFNTSKTGNAFAELQQAQKLYASTDNKSGQIAVFKAFADYYYENQLWSEAESYYQRAIPLIARPDTAVSSAELQLRLAKTAMELNKYEFAQEYIDNALAGFTYKGLKGRMAECQLALAKVKRKAQNYYQAEKIVLNHALPLVQAAPDRFYRIACFDELGHIYRETKKYSQAKWFYIQANMQARMSKDTIAIINSLINLGNVKSDIKDYSLAIKDFKEAEILAKKNDLLVQIAEVNKAFAEVYNKSGNKAEAARYSRSYAVSSDSLAHAQKNRELLAQQAKEDAKKILNPAKKTEKSAEKSDIYYLVKYFLAGILVIIAAGSLFYFRKKK